MKKLCCPLLIFTALVASRSTVADDTLIDTARSLASRIGNGVITIEAVATIMIEGSPPRDQQFSLPGTVIDETGLTVISSSSMMSIKSMLKRRTRRNIETKLSDFVMIFADGSEIDAQLLLTDDKLAVAFVAPAEELDEEDAALITPITLPLEEKDVKLLDEAIVIGRTVKSLDRTLKIKLGRVNAIVTKPRTQYLGDFGSPGLPVFNAEGELIGITGAMRTSYSERLTPVIPAHEIAKVAAQAIDATESDEPSESVDAGDEPPSDESESATTENPTELSDSSG